MGSRVFSFTKAQEGGESQASVIARLKEAGIRAKPAVSPYVGQTAVEVISDNARTLARAARVIYGR